MFNDNFQLTQAVLDGSKTQTRRKVKFVLGKLCKGGYKVVETERLYKHGDKWLFMYLCRCYELPKESCPKYQVGEVVAIAQPYKDIIETSAELYDILLDNSGEVLSEYKAGWTNKMLVKASLMPHHIRITNIRAERLQDISDEDCKAEDIRYYHNDDENGNIFGYGYLVNNGGLHLFDTPREAYASLIDKISSTGTWESNPWVWVYDFELVK